MNIDHLQRFHHDSTGIHDDPNGEYLWYQDVINALQADEKERVRCVEKLRDIFAARETEREGFTAAAEPPAAEKGT